MTLVVDASVVVALLIDDGPDGSWAAQLCRGEVLAAPDHMPVEAANVLRRAVLAGDITSDSAILAHADLLDLRVELFPYSATADRCWELRDTITTYDAAYVALAEQLDVSLATLDGRLARAPGPRCTFAIPDVGDRGKPR